MGKKPNRVKSLTEEEIDILWNGKQLGHSTPRSLIQTVWWNNCLYFGMRGREEHYDLRMEYFTIKHD